MQPLWQTEGQALLWIQDNLRQDWLTPIMQVITRFGDGGYFFIALCVLLLCIPKSRRVGIATSLSLALDGIVTNLWLKNAINRVRPYVRFTELIPLTTLPKDASFPSGHTAVSFTVAAAVYMAGCKKAGLLLYAVAALIGFSRLYLGVHFPSDVIGGAMVGVLCAWIIRRMFCLVADIKKRKKRKKAKNAKKA